jgi:ribonuclease T2
MRRGILTTMATAIVGLVLLSWTLPAGAKVVTGAKPGEYDYLVLSLSWSPTWCTTRSGKANKIECGDKKYGFVLHGLWPQYQNGGYPKMCALPTPLPEGAMGATESVMPNHRLAEHEWQLHGTCFGGDAKAFFARAKAAWDRIKIPTDYQTATQTRSITADKVRQAFLAANPGMVGTGIAVSCRKPRVKGAAADHPAQPQLTEVRICLDKDLKFQACGKGVRDRCPDSADMPAAP